MSIPTRSAGFWGRREPAGARFIAGEMTVGTRIFTKPELRGVVGLSMAGVDAIAAGFAMLSRGKVRQPPIMRVDVPDRNGELDVKAAYVEGWDSFAVKMSTGFFDNPARGLPTGLGLMVLFSAETGATQALLLDDGYLTRVRTALAGAVAARALAPQEVKAAGILGAGDQARWQLRVLALVRELRLVYVWARRPDQAAEFAREMSRETGVEVCVADSPEDLVRACDVVVTTTPSREPIIEAAWLHPGLHITALGSDAESKQELAEEAVAAADVFACDHLGQSRRLGELRAVEQSGITPESTPVELGTILVGGHPGRSADDEITICDLTGTGVQDTVIARLAVDRCLAAGLGIEVATH